MRSDALPCAMPMFAEPDAKMSPDMRVTPSGSV
jgi:hypothetical protein